MSLVLLVGCIDQIGISELKRLGYTNIQIIGYAPITKCPLRHLSDRA